jgi:hypothetical protein
MRCPRGGWDAERSHDAKLNYNAYLFYIIAVGGRSELLATKIESVSAPFRLTGTRDGLVVPQSVSAAAEAQAVRVVPGLAGVAVGLPVLHRGAGGLKALGLGWRVQPWM